MGSPQGGSYISGVGLDNQPLCISAIWGVTPHSREPMLLLFRLLGWRRLVLSLSPMGQDFRVPAYPMVTPRGFEPTPCRLRGDRLSHLTMAPYRFLGVYLSKEPAQEPHPSTAPPSHMGDWEPLHPSVLPNPFISSTKFFLNEWDELGSPMVTHPGFEPEICWWRTNRPNH